MNRSPAWSPHTHWTVDEELAGVAEVEHHFGAERIVDRDIDQRAARRHVAKADGIAVVGEMDFAHPDQRMPLFVAVAEIFFRCLGSAFVELPELSSVTSSGKLRWMTAEQKRRALLRIAFDARFVREFQADGIALDPANRALQARALAELKLDHVPKLRLEAAADHGAAARQVHDLDVMRLALVDEPSRSRRSGDGGRRRDDCPCAFPSAALARVPGASPAPSRCGFLSVTTSDRFVPAQDRRPEAVARGLDTHEATIA